MQVQIRAGTGCLLFSFINTMDSWDTIVVGAGLGGLTAAATLVKAGKRVLVLEKNPHIGGTAYVYHRNGFTFPMGPLGFSNPENIARILKELNQGNDFSCNRVHYRLKAFDLDLMLSLPSPTMIEELTRHFPEESVAIKRFFHDVIEVAAPLKCPHNSTNSRPLSRQHDISVDEYLNELTDDWRLQRILGSLGTRKPYASFPLQAAMWNIIGNKGIWYPQGGFASFCNRLAKAVIGDRNAPSGVIKLGTEVERIVVEHGRVAGAILRDGTAVRSTSVISNADYRSTFLTLLKPGVVPKWQSAVSKAKQSGSMFQVCLGVDADKVDLSIFKAASRVIYRRSDGNATMETEVDWGDKEVDLDAVAMQEIELSCWSKDDENLAPKRKAVIIIRTEAPYQHFSRFRLGWRSRTAGYHSYKVRIAQALTNEVKKVLPGLDKGILATNIATPLTFEDQGGRSQGAVAGWSWDYEDSHDSSLKELVATPIEGLYMAGYQAFSALFMGGVPTAMESGRRAARAVLQRAGPVKEIKIPGVR